MRYAFDEGAAPGRHETQYFEMFCNRGIYHNGWTAVTRHSVPWDITVPMPPLLEDRWELYSDTDWTQAHDLSAEMPDKLAALQQLWLIEVSKYNVLPLDDRRVERFNSDLAGRPMLIKGTQQMLFNGMRRLSENSVLNLKNKSHTITCEIEVEGCEGERCDRRAGRRVRWMVACTSSMARRGTATTCSALQRFHVGGDAARACRHPPGPGRVHLRRWRPREGRHRRDLPRRLEGGRGARRGHGPDGVLGRRDARPRQRHGLTGERRVHVGDESRSRAR